MAIQAVNLKKQIPSMRRDPKIVWSPQTESIKKQCTTLTVTSGKGGVGKTNFIVNFALLLKKRGFRVLLVDADLGLANVDILLGLTPKFTIHDYLHHKISLNEVLYQGPENIEIISAKNGLGAMEQLSKDNLLKMIDLFDQFEQEYDYILIDTSAGISFQTTSFVFSSHEVFLILTPEPTSMIDAYSLIKLIVQSNPLKKIYAVVNMAKNKREADETFNKISELTKKFLNKPLINLGFLPADQEVVRSIKLQKPLVLNRIESQFSQNILKINQSWIKYNRPKSNYSFTHNFKELFCNYGL